jgi:hypothetical protein
MFYLVVNNFLMMAGGFIFLFALWVLMLCLRDGEEWFSWGWWAAVAIILVGAFIGVALYTMGAAHYIGS